MGTATVPHVVFKRFLGLVTWEPASWRSGAMLNLGVGDDGDGDFHGLGSFEKSSISHTYELDHD